MSGAFNVIKIRFSLLSFLFKIFNCNYLFWEDGARLSQETKHLRKKCAAKKSGLPSPHLRGRGSALGIVGDFPHRIEVPCHETSWNTRAPFVKHKCYSCLHSETIALSFMQGEKQFIRTESSEAFFEGTDFIWNRAWGSSSLNILSEAMEMLVLYS